MRMEYAVAISLALLAAAILLLFVLVYLKHRRIASTQDGPGRLADAEIQTRMAEMRKLLADADRKIDRLRDLTAGSDESAELAWSDSSGHPKGDEIIRLGRQGLDAVEIARRLHTPVGEVQLVLNLSHANKTKSDEPEKIRLPGE